MSLDLYWLTLYCASYESPNPAKRLLLLIIFRKKKKHTFAHLNNTEKLGYSTKGQKIYLLESLEIEK